MQIYVQCNKKTMTRLIEKMENCSESSFILFVKTSPVESPLWTERPGWGVYTLVHTVCPSVGVQLAMVTNPLKRIFRFSKNVESPPELLRDHLVINKQVDSIF